MIVRTWKTLPKLVRFMVRNAALGIGFGWALLGALLWADVGGLGSLIGHSRLAGPALFLLFGGFAVTFGGAAVSTAVLLGHEFEDDRDLDKAGPAVVTDEPLPATLPAKTR